MRHNERRHSDLCVSDDACVALKEQFAAHSSLPNCKGKKKGRLSLGATVLAITVVWTLVLPWVGSRPPVRERIEYLDRQGVDPAALYYTDIEAMGRVESNLAAIRQANPDAFWSIAPIDRK